MDEQVKCPCKWKSCKRYGKCEECIAHHNKHAKHPLPFCQKQKSTAGSAQKTRKPQE